MPREIVSLSNVSYGYPDGTLALEDISLEIREGECAVLLGPNGAGKSTLLLILAGLVPASAGTVRVYRTLIDKKSVESPEGLLWMRRKLGIVFQDADVALFNSTVWREVTFGPLHLGLSKQDTFQRASRALKVMGISHLKDRAPHQLSGGEKQRVSIASVLSIEPEMILFDEPTAGLDPGSKKAILGIIRRLSKQGKTILVSTHDVDFAAEISSRTIILNKKIVADGRMREIFMDEELLKNQNLDLPNIAKLFKVLKKFGYKVDKLPFSMDDAIQELTRTIDESGGHIHLHLHKHEHKGSNDHHK